MIFMNNPSNRLIARGNKSKIYNCLESIGFENEHEINTFLSFIDNNKGVLSDGEIYQVKTKLPSLEAGTMGFLIMESEYYINLKYSTIIILSLILDIKLTKGFASVLIGFLGITNTSFVKINEYNGEKCILKETIMQKDKVGNKNLLNKFHGECCNNQYKCKYKINDKCKCKEKDIITIFDNLCEKGVFKKYSSGYKYQL